MTDANMKPGRTDIVLLSEEEKVAGVLVSTVENLWEAVNELTRLRTTHKEYYLVTIFGSARIKNDSIIYSQVRELGAALTRMGCGIVTGGGPGLMQAANEGAASVDPAALQRSFGIRVDLPFEQNANPFVGKAYTHKTFFSRLHHFMIMSDAFIVVEGGVGTLLELSMVWQLLQVRKLYDTPLILIGDMWEQLIEWSRNYMVTPEMAMASELDLQIPTPVKTAAEAIEIVRLHREKWLETNVPNAKSVNL